MYEILSKITVCMLGLDRCIVASHGEPLVDKCYNWLDWIVHSLCPTSRHIQEGTGKERRAHCHNDTLGGPAE